MAKIPSSNGFKPAMSEHNTETEAKVVFFNDKPCHFVSIADNKSDKNFLFVRVVGIV